MKPFSKILFLGLSALLHAIVFASLFLINKATEPERFVTTIDLTDVKTNSSNSKSLKKSEHALSLKKLASTSLEKLPASATDETSATAFDAEVAPTGNSKTPTNSPLQIVNINEVTLSVKRTAEAKIKNIEGKIKLKLLIDEHGDIQKITPLNVLGFGLDEVAIEAARKLIFIPARVNSKNISAEAIYTVNFSLQHQ